MLALGARPIQSLGDQMKPFELAEKFCVEEGFGFRVSGFRLRFGKDCLSAPFRRGGAVKAGYLSGTAQKLRNSFGD